MKGTRSFDAFACDTVLYVFPSYSFGIPTYTMSLLPGKHSSDNSPDVVVRSSRMCWSFFLVAESSCFQFRLRPGDDSGLCPRDNCAFSVQHDHFLSFEGLF